MSKLFKVMLAAKPKPEELDETLAKLRYPVLASPKLDGIRATVQNGRLYSRSMKLIPNNSLQALWGRPELDGLDGEIVVGPPTATDCFNRTTSIVMARNKPADGAVFFVFDKHGSESFVIRNDEAENIVADTDGSLHFVHHEVLNDLRDLQVYEGRQLKRGHEGIMLRSEDGLYKQGRSTLREGGLIAVKRFVDAEAVVLDTYEQEENTNPKALNELGKMRRSSHKAGKVGKGTLGGFTVAPINWWKENGNKGFSVLSGKFNIGTGQGLTDALRAELWAKRKTLPGKIVKYRYQAVGTKDAPRIPIFLGFRDKGDL